MLRLLVAEVATCAARSACGGGGDAPGVASTSQAPDAAAASSASAGPTVDALARRTRTTTTSPTPVSTASSLPTGYVACADEWSQTVCNFSGSTVLYFGSGSSYAYGTVTGPFNCNTGNTVFGDPNPGVAKACYVPQAVLGGTSSGTTTGSTSGTTSGSTGGTTSGSTTGGTGTTSGTTTGTTVNATLVSRSFSSTSQDIPNPERGFYGWAGSDFVNGYDAASVQGAYNSGMRLIFGKVQLDAWRTTDLPASFLTSLGNRLDQVRQAGMKVTLLFNYDFSAGGRDATSSQIKRHLEQLKPVLAAHADVIPFMRAGFIGAWGEWHSSQSGNSCGYNSGSTTCATAAINRAVVRDALIANMPSTTQIGIRYPADLMTWYPSPTQQTRLGMHNDCFLSGPSDSGTYSSTAQRSYVQTLSANTAFGGENCADAEKPLRNTCADILSEGPAYHLAWMNSSDWAGFITAWRNGGCLAQVSGSMGYRLQLDQLIHPAEVAVGQSLPVQVDVRNVGWAKLFSPRGLQVRLRHRTSGALIQATAGDLSTLPAQGTAATRLSVTVAIPSGAATGDYDVLLAAPDSFSTTAGDARFAIRFANADNSASNQAWEASAAQWRTGSVVTVR